MILRSLPIVATPYRKNKLQSKNLRYKAQYDKKGGAGKSNLEDWIYYHDLGMFVPSTIDSAQAVMQYVCSAMPKVAPTLIIIDIPRQCTSAAKLYTSIESIKDGKVYDTRYKGKMRRFKRPRIVVFCNNLPHFSWLSPGRMKLWIIKKGILTVSDIYKEQKYSFFFFFGRNTVFHKVLCDVTLSYA